MQNNTAVSSSSNGAPVATGGVTSSAAPKGFRQKVSQMIAGLQAVIPDGSSVTVGGQAIAKSDLVSEMTQVITAYQALDAAVLTAKGVRLQLRAQIPGFRKQFLDLKDGLISSLGRGNPQLAQFGMAASKPKPLSPEQKVVRAAKALKTRAMRHTMGPRKKAAVRYTGKLQVSVDETAPATTPADGTTTAASTVATQGTVVAAVPVATPGPANGHTQ